MVITICVCRFIKMSSPNMNNLIIVGCILSYLGVIVLGVDGRLVAPDNFHYLCSVCENYLKISSAIF